MPKAAGAGSSAVVVVKTLALTIAAGLACAIPLECRAAAGAALQFDGATTYVQAANSPALNAFPMTVSAWFRTTNGVASIQGIVGKYANASGDGYFIIVQNGKLRGYYASLGNLAIDAQTAGSVADGFWHHVAMTVDASGGKLYYDGAQIGSRTWSSGAAPTSAQPFLIGDYWQTPYVFQGQIDEVTLWNRSLGGAEVNYLKHRQLNGNEDGLVGLWHLDDGAGSATAADATGHNHDGALMNGPVWIASTAPIVLNQVAGTAVKFSGGNDSESVTIPNDPALDAYPLTVMAWVRTTRTAAQGDGIVTKYPDGLKNGYAIFLLNGHVRAWYFKDAANYVWDGSEGLDGGAIADGQWHHIAFVVDSLSGRLYVDGSQTAILNWHGSGGATTTANPLKIGEYDTYTNSLQGVIDEVSVWNTALSVSQLGAYKNAPLAGSETGLVGLWRLDDGVSTTASDATGHSHDGALVNGPLWTGSTAFLGDGTSAVSVTLGAVQWARQFAVKTIATENSFTATAPFWARRLDDFGGPTASSSVAVTLDSALESSLLGGPELLVNSTTNFVVTVAAYNAAIPQSSAGGVAQSPAVQIQPDPSAQLDSVNDTFQLGVTESFSVGSGAAQTVETVNSAAAPLMHFDGHLFFGAVDTIFSALSGSPSRGAPSGGGIATSLNVLTGSLAANPNHQYGSGAAIGAVLLSSGDAIATGNATLAAPSPDIGTINNIPFARSAEKLSPAGATASVAVMMPLGFSLGTSPSNRFTTNFVACGTLNLDANLEPTNNALTLNGPFYAIQETLPYWFGAPSFTWQIQSGQLVFNPASGVFVRQHEDDNLSAVGPLIAEPNDANRISNDGYFRNATPAGLLVVTADSNGVANVTTALTLNPPELRPHFPFTSNAPAYGIATAGGALSIVDNLADPSSYLTIPAPAPLLYGRDCPYAGCSSGQIGPAELDFTADTGQWNFTPDGGLLAYGSVPSQNLQWGYATGGNFAQQAGPVSVGAYCMAGTFLRADQTSIGDPQRAGVLLFSGFGDASDPTYMERPGGANYNDGFANYAGVNFRSPEEGESYIGQADSGSYALDSVSKYYASFGGVSGIHQAQDGAFPGGMKLYGYNFTFSDFGLSYLDGKNDQSVTTGAVWFQPEPAGFTQPFDRMTLTCRGDLESASVPAGGGAAHLAYWNVDLTPLSIDFHPTNNDTCGTSPRFLAIGSQMKLPFIPQELHATIGFQPNGNLITVADNVSNVTSRFPVPGQLSLQGPGTTMFALSTCAEGYFNNWAAPNAAALSTGFFNLAGKLRMPFFDDVKVHLHVTPLNDGKAQIDVMGGWPSAGSTAPDLGWTVNGGNFFNVVNYDPAAWGWPAGLDIGAYRNSSTTTYRPRAQRDWIEVATFDYPLRWDNTLRSFKGFQDGTVKLPVTDVQSRLKELAPGKVDFDFAQDVRVQLPQVKELDCVNDALNGNIGPLLSVSNAIRKTVNQGLDVTGLNDLQLALREDAQDFFNPILAQTIDPLVVQLMPQITAHSQANVPLFLQQVYSDITAPAGPLATGITALNNVSDQASSVVLTLDQSLDKVLQIGGVLDDILDKDPSTGERHAVTEIVKQLVNDQSGALNFLGGLADEEINPLIADADGTLSEIQFDIADATNQLADVKEQLDDSAGDFNQALSSVMSDGASVNQFIQAAAKNVTNYLAGALTPAGDLFTANPAAVREAIRKQIATAFLSSALTGNYQTAFREFLGDDNVLLDEVMGELFDQINSTIRNALTDQIEGSQDGIFQALKGAGLLSGSMFSAKLRGSPTFNGDSLRNIHLNADIQLKMPDKMNFTGYMNISELDSQSVPVACVPDGGPSAEVTLGAKNVPLNWAGVTSGQSAQSLNLSAEARWTLQSGSVIGIGGTLIIAGGASVEGCQLKELGAMLAIGKTENYFAAKADATVPVLGIPVEVQAGLFAGHACTLDPLKFVDSEVEQVLLDHPDQFSGVYVEFGGGLSLSDLLGLGGLGCVLNADASITTAYYFEGGASYGTIGGRQKMSVDISLLCVLSGHADWAEFLALDTTGRLTVGGSANVCGSAGPCPFCVKGCKGVTVMGVVSTHGIDYSVDY